MIRARQSTMAPSFRLLVILKVNFKFVQITNGRYEFHELICSNSL